MDESAYEEAANGIVEFESSLAEVHVLYDLCALLLFSLILVTTCLILSSLWPGVMRYMYTHSHIHAHTRAHEHICTHTHSLSTCTQICTWWISMKDGPCHAKFWSNSLFVDFYYVPNYEVHIPLFFYKGTCIHNYTYYVYMYICV